MEDRVLAVVGDKEITESIVMKFLNDLGPQMAMQFRSPDGMKRVVEELVNQEIVYKEALKENLQEMDEFKEELKKLEEGLLKQYAINRILMNVEVTEDDLKEYYESNKEIFKSPEMASASHILVEDQALADEIYEKINNGESFEELALKHSTCPSKNQGGNLGEFGRGQMVPEFEEAVFNMEEGAVSEPVQTQFGYHIIKLGSIKEPGISPFEEVKPQLHQQLLGMKQQEAYLNKINQIKENYDVKFNI